MSRFAVPSLIVAAVVLALAVIAVVLGLNLLPGRAEAIERGVYAPWIIVWAMIAITDLCAVGLAGFLLSVGLKGPSSNSPSHV